MPSLENTFKEFHLVFSELALALVQGQTFLSQSLENGLQVVFVFYERLSKHQDVVTDVDRAVNTLKRLPDYVLGDLSSALYSKVETSVSHETRVC